MFRDNFSIVNFSLRSLVVVRDALLVCLVAPFMCLVWLVELAFDLLWRVVIKSCCKLLVKASAALDLLANISALLEQFGWLMALFLFPSDLLTVWSGLTAYFAVAIATTKGIRWAIRKIPVIANASDLQFSGVAACKRWLLQSIDHLRISLNCLQDAVP